MADTRSGDPGATLAMEIPAASELAIRLTRQAPREAAKLLRRFPDQAAARALSLVNPALTVDILSFFPEERRARIAAADPSGRGEQWLIDRDYAAHTVGRQMDKPLAVFAPDTTVQEAIERLRDLVKRARLHLAFVTERGRHAARGLRLPRATVRAARRAGLDR